MAYPLRNEMVQQEEAPEVVNLACPDCDGKGEIDFAYDDPFYGPGCTRMESCPECLGAGFFTMKFWPAGDGGYYAVRLVGDRNTAEGATFGWCQTIEDARRGFFWHASIITPRFVTDEERDALVRAGVVG